MAGERMGERGFMVKEWEGGGARRKSYRVLYFRVHKIQQTMIGGAMTWLPGCP